jgi:hypothetical protein
MASNGIRVMIVIEMDRGFSFVFEAFRVHTSAPTPAILTALFRLIKSFQANSGIVPEIRPRPLPKSSFNNDSVIRCYMV